MPHPPPKPSPTRACPTTYDPTPPSPERPLLLLQTQLPNGFTIIAERTPASRSLALGAFIKAGARDELPAQNGVSHFLEHLCFKGFGGLEAGGLNAQGLNAAFDAIGTRVDAFTTQELTAYHAAALPESQARLTELLLGMLRPTLRAEDVDLERQVILEEIEMYRDDPGSVVFEAGMRHYFGSHPFAQSVLGTPESLEGLTADTIRAHLETWYAPDKVVLVACGNLDWEALVAQATRLTADWQPSRAARLHPPFAPTFGDFNLPHSSTRAQAALLAPGVAVEDGLHLAAGVLGQIIGDSNSRLYWALVDDGLCDEASLEHQAEDGLGTFYGSLSCDPSDLEEALERYRGVLETVQRDGIRPGELARTKKKIEVSLALRFETPHARLVSLAEDFVSLGEYRSVADLLSEVRGVTLQQVGAVLERQPFDRLCVTTLQPSRS